MDPPGAGTLTLVVEKGPRKGETVECRPGGRVRIGRVIRGNTFTIKDSGISQTHLSIEAAPGSGAMWALTDLGSSNGTLLNGVRIEPSVPAVLRDADAVKIGEETAFLVRIAVPETAEPPPAVGRRRNPRRGCAAVAEAPPLEEAGGAARGRRRTRRTAAAGGDDTGDGERADSKVEESVKNKPNKNTAAGRGRGAARKAATDSGSLPSVSEESGKGDLEAVENGDCNINLNEVKPAEVHDTAQIPSVKRPERGVRRERGTPARHTTTAVASAKEQARVGDARVAPFGVEVEEEEEEAAAGGDDTGDGERADSNVEESVKNKPNKNTAAGRGRGAARKAATDSGSLPSVSEESGKGDLEAVENGDCKILKEVKPEVHDSPQIPSVKRPERGVRREQGAPARATTTAVASAKEQARVGDARVAPVGVEVEEEEEEAVAAGANPAVEKSCVDMDSMTVDEWFDRMGKYLRKMINGTADEVISEIKAKAERFKEYVGNSLDPAQRDRGGG